MVKNLWHRRLGDVSVMSGSPPLKRLECKGGTLFTAGGYYLCCTDSALNTAMAGDDFICVKVFLLLRQLRTFTSFIACTRHASRHWTP